MTPGAVVFDNYGSEVSYTHLDRLTQALEQGNSGRMAHSMTGQEGE